eukprot:65855-Rhodomonas_salina.2
MLRLGRCLLRAYRSRHTKRTSNSVICVDERRSRFAAATMPFSAIVADQAAAGKKEAQFTQLWSMQGLGAATSPAAVSSTSFYASSGPGSTPGGYVLPSN